MTPHGWSVQWWFLSNLIMIFHVQHKHITMNVMVVDELTLASFVNSCGNWINFHYTFLVIRWNNKIPVMAPLQDHLHFAVHLVRGKMAQLTRNLLNPHTWMNACHISKPHISGDAKKSAPLFYSHLADLHLACVIRWLMCRSSQW